MDAIVERVLEHLGREGVQPVTPMGTGKSSSSSGGSSGGEYSAIILGQFHGEADERNLGNAKYTGRDGVHPVLPRCRLMAKAEWKII